MFSRGLCWSLNLMRLIIQFKFYRDKLKRNITCLVAILIHVMHFTPIKYHQPDVVSALKFMVITEQSYGTLNDQIWICHRIPCLELNFFFGVVSFFSRKAFVRAGLRTSCHQSYTGRRVLGEDRKINGLWQKLLVGDTWYIESCLEQT